MGIIIFDMDFNQSARNNPAVYIWQSLLNAEGNEVKW